MMKYYSENCGALFYRTLLGKKDNIYAINWPKVPTHPSMKYFKELGYWNGMAVLRFLEDALDIFFFVSDVHNTEIQNFYIKNYENNIRFAEHIFSSNNDILMQHEDILGVPLVNKMVPEILQTKADIESQFKKEQLKIKKFFDSILRPEFVLSKQEYRCIELLAKGKTMKEIGQILGLSPRTVEHYIENAKEKTGCNFKSQIIDMFFEDRLTNKL